MTKTDALIRMEFVLWDAANLTLKIPWFSKFCSSQFNVLWWYDGICLYWNQASCENGTSLSHILLSALFFVAFCYKLHCYTRSHWMKLQAFDWNYLWFAPSRIFVHNIAKKIQCFVSPHKQRTIFSEITHHKKQWTVIYSQRIFSTW